MSTETRKFTKATGKKCKFGNWWDLHKIGYIKNPYLYFDGLNSCRHEFAVLEEFFQ